MQNIIPLVLVNQNSICLYKCKPNSQQRYNHHQVPRRDTYEPPISVMKSYHALNYFTRNIRPVHEAHNQPVPSGKFQNAERCALFCIQIYSFVEITTAGSNIICLFSGGYRIIMFFAPTRASPRQQWPALD